MKPNIEPIDVLLKCQDINGHIIADKDGRTANEGFFAAGDVCQKQARQALTAASDGANAVQSVIQYLKER